MEIELTSFQSKVLDLLESKNGEEIDFNEISRMNDYSCNEVAILVKGDLIAIAIDRKRLILSITPKGEAALKNAK